ncbi:MAG TPA: SpoIIE family protein phosphatase [Candidatus Eisenbacteria bacterium]|nr:SpoIIE family protein phosphatase [Candidatus Eisenbacteria bacterium]
MATGGAPAYQTGAPGASRRLSRFSLLLAANLFVVSTVLLRVPFFEIVELKTQDLRLRTRGQHAVHPDIVVIAIDDNSLISYHNEWPIERKFYALLLTALQSWGAKAVGVDLWFSGRDRFNDRNDELLALVTANSPSVIHALNLNLFAPGSRAGPAGQISEPRDSLAVRLFKPLPTNIHLMASYSQFDLPPDLLEASNALGHIELDRDVDNVSRYAPLEVEHQGSAIPALSLLMACRYLGADWRAARFEPGNPFREGHLVLDTSSGRIAIPIDAYGRTLINFPGDETSFRTIRFDRAMNAAQFSGGAIPSDLPQPEMFKGKVVLLCSTAYKVLIADVGPTPFSDNFPLAYSHASVVNSILRRDFLHTIPHGYETVGLGAIALGLGLWLPVLAPGALAVVAVAFLVGLVGLAWSLLVFFGIQMSLVPPLFLVLSLSVGVMLRAYVVRDHERRAVEQELAVARRVQQDLLPKQPLTAGDLEVSGMNLPCYAVGGDYFDYYTLADGRIAIAIGDVAGKGVPAALLMSKLQATLRGETSHEVTVPEVPERANRLLMESMEGSSKFVTFFYGALEPGTRRLRYSNAGHNPPYLLRADGTLEELETGGLLLGIFPHASYDEGEVELGPGDVIVLFTDGVTEAEDRHKGQFGEERLIALLREARAGDARAIGDRICQEVLKFSKGLQMADDLTVVVVKVKEAAA